VGTGNILGVKPQIPWLGRFESHPIVLAVISADKDDDPDESAIFRGSEGLLKERWRPVADIYPVS